MDLVTGATGIVGTPLVVKLLSQGQTVRALHRPSSDRARVEQAVREPIQTTSPGWSGSKAI